MIDLDRFKDINDTWGHLAGDAALRYAAGVLKRCCRETDVVARYGGDEFAVLFISADVAHAEAVMRRVQRELTEKPFTVEGHPQGLGLSFGLATSVPGDIPRPDDILQAADRNLYAMKRALR
jgi:diguanylate cyclase (GGDEF)-like protein